MKLALVAAVAKNGAIGRKNALLWHEPEDQKHFRRTTLGSPVVMGRRTWDSLPTRFKPLPGRRNIVVTRDALWRAKGAETAISLDDALALAADAERVYVIGGGELYALALPRADELVLTEIDTELEGDTYFPPFRDHFDEVAREPHTTADGLPYAFVTYRAKARAS